MVTTLSGFSQTGSYFMTHYNPAEYNFDNANYEIYQDDRGVMHIANRQGILHYDGNSWWLTPIPFSVYCIAAGDSLTFVGGRGGLGYIHNNELNGTQYHPIDTTTRDIQKVVVNRHDGYYITDDKLFHFRTTAPWPITEIVTNEAELLDLAQVDEKVFVSTSDGLQEITTDKTIKKADYAPEGAFFIRKSANGRVLYLTDSSYIYTVFEGKLEKLDFVNQDYLTEHTVTEIAFATDSLIAISTLSGGIIFVEVPTGETVQIIDYDSGLPDNQILNMYLDSTGGLWVSHDFGFTVISPRVPLRSFNNYPGLKGSLVNVIPYNDQLYVGTSLGVFHLAANKQMKETVVYDKVRMRIASNPKEVVNKKVRRGLFKKKKRQQQEETTPKYHYVFRKRIVEEELSRSYEYKKVGGINAKVVSSMVYKDRLLVGTVQGLYQVDEDTAYLINEVPVLYMFGLPGKNLAFVSTVDEEVKVLSLYNGTWRETKMLEGLNDYIDQISLDPEENVWLCGADSLYRIELENRELIDVEVYHIENPHFEKIYSTNYNNKILFINSSGYYAYENLQIVIQLEIEAQIGLPRKFIVGAEGQLLINTGNSWYGAGNNIRTSLNFLSFFTDPVAVTRDDSYYYWVATASNDLYRINILELAKMEVSEDIYLKEIRNNNIPLPVKSQLNVDQEGSQLSFEFASPDYTGIYRKEYQFRLTNAGGTQSPWSAWSENNNLISYQFLPPGSYTLEARTRNTLGKEISAEPFKFKVIAPYWKRPWFYVLEVLFFGGMLLFSYYLNHGVGKYGFISRLLGFMTLILVVEFFQTIAEYYYEAYYSPVINFFIQAFIALMILPIEGLLRRLIYHEPKNKDIKKEVA